MHLSKWMSRAFAVVACVALLPLAALAMEEAAATHPDKLDATLRDRLAAGGRSDLLVRFAEQADLSAAYGMEWQARGEYVAAALQAVAQRSQARAIATLDASGLRHESFMAGNDLYVWGADLDAALQLSALPEVAAIRADRVYYLDPIVSAPPQTTATTDWGLIDTGATAFWTTFGVQGDGIKVANIDTGVQWNHPGLDQAFACPGQPTNAACWKDPSNICGAGGACDNNGHGTHTMGTMVADDDASLSYVAGMAPNATWIACKGCESNSCSDYALNTCADWILAPGGTTANRPHIVNNSWGGGGGDTWYQAKVQAWVTAGIFPAFSAGNSGSSCSTIGSPGDYQESFASAAHSSSRAIASFSSRGPSAFGHDPYTKPNISAPGVSVCSTVPTNSWSCGYSGTSMASPHSAGAVALLWSCNASLIGQIDQTFQLLQNNADTPPAGNCVPPPDGQGNYTYGYGYLNVLAAGNAGCGATPTPPDAPTNLTASAVSSSQINLAWTDNADNESGFKIERSLDGVSFAQIATVGANVTSYSSTGLSPNTTYYYRVRAYNGAGDSAYSNVASATTPTALTMHVDSISLGYTQVRGKYRVTALGTIRDQNGGSVGSATVSAKWTYPPNKTKNATATTNSSGIATFTIQAGAGFYTLCVTNVTKAGYVFVPGLNDCKSRSVP